MKMKHIVIIPNPKKDKNFSVTKNLVEKLNFFGSAVYIEKKYGECFNSSVILYNEFPKSAEAIIVVGGDGSVLDASVTAIENDIPLLAVNLGKVGYLSEVEPDNLDILSMHKLHR